MSPPSDHFNENWQLSGSSILTPKRETNVGALELPDARLFTLLRRLLQAIMIEKKVDSHGSPARRTGRDGAQWSECIGLGDAFFFFGIESDSRAEKGESIADLRLVGHVFYALNRVETTIDGNVGTDEPVEVIAGAIEFPNESPSATRHLTLDGWIDLDRVDDDEIFVCQGRWGDEFRSIALFDELFAERLERLRIVGIGLRHET